MDQGVRWTPRLDPSFSNGIGNSTTLHLSINQSIPQQLLSIQVSEERLVELLEQVSSQEKKATKVTIMRRRFDEDDDDNDDDLL